MDRLSKASEVAEAAHAGQVDKAGKAYIHHPRYVRDQCATEDEKIVALLHDVLEDSEMTPEDLAAEGFEPYIVGAVVAITKVEGESYGDYLARVKANDIARIVKIEDIKHNMDESRLPTKSAPIKRMRKYEEALRFLSESD
jgi:(p)ppGpp synthase/HD superfamily hydrolase